jgi:hypothetical protein
LRDIIRSCINLLMESGQLVEKRPAMSAMKLVASLEEASVSAVMLAYR